MEVTVYKCEECGFLFEKKEDYEAHQEEEKTKKAWDKKYPDVKEDDCEFANGGYSIQRTEEWFKQLEKDLLEIIAPLNISSATYKWRCICQTCFREWGQPYYADNCNHQDGGKK
ncbi:MAG: hypothetical protein GY861_27015 [bacterium]|nr:hypothetical protein [bacterium]